MFLSPEIDEYLDIHESGNTGTIKTDQWVTDLAKAAQLKVKTLFLWDGTVEQLEMMWILQLKDETVRS